MDKTHIESLMDLPIGAVLSIALGARLALNEYGDEVPEGINRFLERASFLGAQYVADLVFGEADD